MSVLMRATEVIKRPVVTLAGEAVAQVKDIVYEGDGGHVGGFTLAGRGLFAGPLKVALGWESVSALGNDALMIRDEGVFEAPEQVVSRSTARRGDVLGSRVMTDDGTELGTITDVILGVTDVADVIGYEIDSSPALGKDGRRVLIPLPDTLSISGEALMLPSAAKEFVSDDLAGFGAAVQEFRTRLAGGGAT
ncbi:MAG: PRC-barrel domain-containing protein [Nocardioidaceae bacterium]|jgi:uncharacterized protein YrrD|nr:PRC-barrel domain-containing protein [Nocardioidaceae bacterium]